MLANQANSSELSFKLLNNYVINSKMFEMVNSSVVINCCHNY